MKHRVIRLALPILIILALLSIVCLVFYHFLVQPENMRISHDSGIYHDAIEIEVASKLPGTILYTTNGETPTIHNENAKEYTEPIFLPLGEETTAYSLKFICIYPNKTFSEVYTRDYIIEQNPERFTTTYVLSLTGSEEALLGYEHGIFVRGRSFDEYMAEHPDVDVLGTIIPANYLSDIELPVHAAFFAKDGTSLVSQNCGVKIYGNITRAKNQRSFRLIARDTYEGALNRFTYAFLPNLKSERTNTVIDEFQRLSFHSSGNDHGYGFVRTELIGELARREGFPDVLVSESVTVYINGAYQGVFWLQNAFDDRYFKEKYGEYTGEMVICEGMLGQMDEANAKNEYEISCTAEYNDFCNWLIEADLQKEENWKRVCDTLDLQNFAQYMAIEYFVDNSDWPANNVKVYRYLCGEQEDYQEGTVMDGRYRYLLFDTDYGMGLKFLGWFGGDVASRRLEDLSLNSGYSAIFRALLKRDEFKRMFVNSLLCLMNKSFSAEEVSTVLAELNEKRTDELQYMMEETTLLKDSIWEPDDNNMDNVRQEWEEIQYFAENRYLTVVSELEELWFYGSLVDVSIHLSEEGDIKIGNIFVGQDYDGYWMEEFPMEISCNTNPGVLVRGYRINGEYVEGEQLSLFLADWKRGNQRIEIEPVVSKTSTESLHIKSYDIDGPEDYVVLENNGQTEISLSEYYVTDSQEDLFKGGLPAVVLKPGQEFIIYGKKYDKEFAENSVQISFSWNRDESVYLVHRRDGIIEVGMR